ncbi:MAG: hypothetical protein KBF21_14285 [Thermoanaerobaculia bacterium]|nr:hypothetical protein [Thermoanaerobaculia bacterium]MBP9825389.1 hypothetical protein [Thermoanaerobaculia bacterium]
MKLAATPEDVIPKMLEELIPERAEVNFSSYEYQPGVLADSREIFVLRREHLADEYCKLRASLSRGRDLAMHSQVLIRHGERVEIFHIPMVDFKTPTIEDGWSTIVEILADFQCSSGALFFSGQSWHLYGAALVPQARWSSLIGSLLLANKDGGRQIVDCRWIGHRLRAGYCSLRWTANQPKYLGKPQLVFLGELRRLKHRHFVNFVKELAETPRHRKSREAPRAAAQLQSVI